MPDLTVPAVLLALVLLILLGQWIMVKRARSTRGTVAPIELLRLLPPHDTGNPPTEGVFFFESPGCMPCRRMAPVVAAVLQQHPVPFCPVNVQEHPGLARTMRIMGTPTLILVQEGRIAHVSVGGLAKPRLQALIAKYWPVEAANDRP